ncbi:cytochrome P450 [Phyllosticta capitalensis]|uniref:Bifunctional cytochrome P450/NADPH--P450 reductase n=1 Tax=Phyllosticta capitalensis TaxID=121624 RepID=A0ABR1YV35_9PEZI
MEKSEIVPVPQPPGLPFVGNLTAIDAEFPLGSLVRLADTYGQIYRLNITGSTRVYISSQALLNEVCDERRFHKSVSNALQQVRNGVHDGLFTAYGPQEKNWGIAHRVLMPAFGPISIRSMFDEMHDIASQLVMKWARYGPANPISVTDDFTRLTLDTLALCAMGFRFNSFYTNDMHPFVQAMSDFLVESGNRALRPAIAQSLMRQAQAKYDADIELMQRTSQELIDARRKTPVEKKDLLNAMLLGRDPKTGEGLNDQSITDNMITFLIAGHETTSGLLSFVFYYLLKSPRAYQKAQQEVDRVIGQGPVNVDHLSQLPFITSILRETLRLTPTAPIFTMESDVSTTLQGKYQVFPNEPIQCLLFKAQRDPAVWGEDAEEWRPERMMDGEFERITKEFPNSWKPFGNGMRGCIGRPFAWQEAMLVVAMLMQNFNFQLDDPQYNLKFKQTLTIKPKDFMMRATLRHGLNPTTLEHALNGTSASTPNPTRPVTPNPNGVQKSGIPLSVFYGSNTGTCEALARRLAGDAPSHGFQVKTVDSLDSANQNLPKDHPVAIITASYEGQPPDNAAHFVAWLENLKGSELKGVNYSVFGCGHHDWATTFHRIPKLVDRVLEERGGKRVAVLGTADAAAGDVFTDFEKWEDEVFWTAMKEQYGSSGSGDSSAATTLDNFNVQVSAPRPSILKQDVKEARVLKNEVLSAPSVPEKRHMEIQLPSDMEYSVGSYVAVLPMNPEENVARVMRYFGLAWDSLITISAATPTTLPTDAPISAHDLFSAYIELDQPASKRNVSTLLNLTKDSKTRAALAHLSGDAFSAEVSAKRISVLDLLETYPTIALPLPSFLSMMPPMRLRQYSISSSPLTNPQTCTLTFAVLDAPALSGAPRRHRGVASSYLARLAPGDALHVAVRPSSNNAFRPPAQPEDTPVIMIGAGAGLAPFRGFVAERAAQVAAGRKLAPAVLFFGCRGRDADDMYREAFDEWEADGVVTVYRAYSRQSEHPDAADCKYVQERVWREREVVTGLWERGAKLFVCGSAAVGREIKEVCVKIAVEKRKEEKGGEEVDVERVEKWFESVRGERFATDVFA